MAHASAQLACVLFAFAAAGLLQALPVGEHHHEGGPATVAPATGAATAPTTTRLRLRIGPSGRPEIPGLYDGHGGAHITPIQGKADFRRRVLGLVEPPIDANDDNAPVDRTRSALSECPTTRERLEAAGRRQSVSLVQFYMATCPDCQGFSPYFKRLARDIGPHWRPLVRIFVVNCNDQQNIHLCQEENPRLVVPMVRWYVLPVLQADALYAGPRNVTALASAGGDGACPALKYPRALLNVAHRQFVDKQRRDLISLRRATLRLVALMLDELANDSRRVAQRNAIQVSQLHKGATGREPSRELLDALAPHWHHQAQLGRDQPEELSPEAQFLRDLAARAAACIESARSRANELEPPTAGSIRVHVHQHQHKYHNNHKHLPLVALNNTLKVFLVLEARKSFLGRTLIADWSQYVCGGGGARAVALGVQPEQTLVVLRSSDPSLLGLSARNSSRARDIERPLLLGVDLEWELALAAAAGQGDESDALRERLLSAIELATDNSNSPAQLNGTHQNDTTSEQAQREHANWTPELVFPGEERLRYHFNRAIARAMRMKLQENATGEFADAGSSSGANGDGDADAARRTRAPSLPGALLAGVHPGEIAPRHADGDTRAVDAKTDDLSLMFLTDYYKALDEILHLDLLSKGDLDGFQLLAGACFLRDLKRHFPFQGDAHGSSAAGKSVARHYVQLAQAAWLRELKSHLLPEVSPSASSTTVAPAAAASSTTVAEASSSDRSTTIAPVVAANGTTVALAAQANATDASAIGQPSRRLRARSARGAELAAATFAATCPSLRQLADALDKLNEVAVHRGSRAASANASLEATLERVRVPARLLERALALTRRQHDVGLPPEKKFKWYYCAGSGPYLRGHTCSLWVLFHTLTVNEYLARVGIGDEGRHGRGDNGDSNADSDGERNGDGATLVGPNVEYKWQIDYGRAPVRPCDPKDPDRAFLAARTSELYVNETQFALANIINFVRYYLPCTNCAAHFSCMVSHSAGLSFGGGGGGSSSSSSNGAHHLLWLWEAHNRVNERTRGTHSEDPARPKHVFPCYEACPDCYLEPPSSERAPLNERKFNTRQLIKFLVARYRKSAILNNKINIEMLYKDAAAR